MDGFKILEFLFNQGESILLFVPSVLAIVDVLVTNLGSILSCGLLNPVDVLTTILVVLIL